MSGVDLVEQGVNIKNLKLDINLGSSTINQEVLTTQYALEISHYGYGLELLILNPELSDLEEFKKRIGYQKQVLDKLNVANPTREMPFNDYMDTREESEITGLWYMHQLLFAQKMSKDDSSKINNLDINKKKLDQIKTEIIKDMSINNLSFNNDAEFLIYYKLLYPKEITINDIDNVIKDLNYDSIINKLYSEDFSRGDDTNSRLKYLLLLKLYNPNGYKNFNLDTNFISNKLLENKKTTLDSKHISVIHNTQIIDNLALLKILGSEIVFTDNGFELIKNKNKISVIDNPIPVERSFA